MPRAPGDKSFKRIEQRGCCGSDDHQAYAAGTPIGAYHSEGFEPQVLLVDAGGEWQNYASDITRTIPVGNGGKFTPEAAAVYDLVLRMQKVSLGTDCSGASSSPRRNAKTSSAPARTGTRFTYMATKSSSLASSRSAFSLATPLPSSNPASQPPFSHTAWATRSGSTCTTRASTSARAPSPFLNRRGPRQTSCMRTSVSAGRSRRAWCSLSSPGVISPSS